MRICRGSGRLHGQTGPQSAGRTRSGLIIFSWFFRCFEFTFIFNRNLSAGASHPADMPVFHAFIPFPEYAPFAYLGPFASEEIKSNLPIRVLFLFGEVRIISFHLPLPPLGLFSRYCKTPILVFSPLAKLVLHPMCPNLVSCIGTLFYIVNVNFVAHVLIVVPRRACWVSLLFYIQVCVNLQANECS